LNGTKAIKEGGNQSGAELSGAEGGRSGVGIRAQAQAHTC